MPLAARVEFLLRDYAHFVQDVESFCERLSALRELRGAAVVERWQAQARAGRFAPVVEELLTLHYDPIYTRSMEKNFAGFAQARDLTLPDGQPATLTAAAAALGAGDG
jgi:tRNA 2-selenouridine synthase